MAIRVKIDTSGIDKLVGTIDEMQERMRNLQPAMRAPAERFKSMIDESFRKSEAPDGSAWKALSPDYEEWKTSKGWSPKPLIKSGARGLQGQTVAQPTKTGIGLGWGPLTPYGEYHQFPRDEKRARRFLPFTGSPQSPVLMGGPKVKRALDLLGRAVVAWIFEGKRS